jgi:ribokinase
MQTKDKNINTRGGKVAVGLGQCSLDHIALVDGLPKEDSKAVAKELLTQGGGPVATALVTLARLGIEARFAGIIGSDDAGKLIKKELNAEGVSTKGVVTRKNSSSQIAHIIVNTKAASRTIIWRPPTGAQLTPAEVKPKFIKDASILLLDGLMKDASLRAAELANKFKTPILLDAGSLRPAVLELIKFSDYIVASSRLAKELARTPLAAIKKIRAINPTARVVTITLGKKGSITCAGGVTIKKNAHKVKAVDTTGAGDVFHGGFAFGILKGYKIDKTIELASAMAALKCLRLGGRTGIPTLRQALRLMKEQAI